MGMQSTVVDLSVSGHGSMCLSELKKQGPTTTVQPQPGFRCFSDVDRIDWSECRCLIGACRGLQVGLRGVKPEWHRCRIRDSGPRAFEVPDHVEWVRRIVLPCCLRGGRRRGLGGEIAPKVLERADQVVKELNDTLIPQGEKLQETKQTSKVDWGDFTNKVKNALKVTKDLGDRLQTMINDAESDDN